VLIIILYGLILGF